MPIVTIEIVCSDEWDGYSSAQIQELSDQLGEIFNSDPGNTWVKLNYLELDHYAENKMLASSPHKPTFVEVLKRSLPDQQALAIEAQQISEKVAQVLSRSRENVVVIYLPAGEGRIAFGGNLFVRTDENQP